jgi:pyruvate dehydrogenase E2 component (dihydrolipoamide acetyltransferase)
MSDVLMPRLADAMVEGTIVAWLVAHGDVVARGQEIVEIETDKGSMAYEADFDGVLSIVLAEGATAAVGEVICTIGAPGEAPSAPPPPPPPASSAPVAAAAAAEDGARLRGGPLPASPVARRLAARLGVDLASVAGTGPRGRILKADVAAAAHEPLSAGESSERGEGAVEAPSRLQAAVARRVSEAKSSAPDFTVEIEIDMTEALALRARMHEVADPPPSVNDMVVRACALALRGHPRVNGSYDGDVYRLHSRVNVGVAVAGDDSLLVPVIRDADTKTLTAIAAEARMLAERARAGGLTPPEMSGGTFTVSNLGMFGVTRFTAILNPPEAAILAVGAVTRRLVPGVDDRPVARSLMAAVLTCDHRIVNGADGARFLADVRSALEAPLSLLG